MKEDNLLSFVQVNVSVNEQAWKQVDTFNDQGPEDRVFTLDPVSGTIHFGDGLRGAIPPSGSTLSVTAKYRIGGDTIEHILSFTGLVPDSHLHKDSLFTVTTLSRSIRFGLYQEIERSWCRKLLAWLCGALRVRFSNSLLD